MKNTLLVIVALLVGGCASTPTMKSVSGTYEFKKDGGAVRMVLLENGITEGYIKGEKWKEAKWSINEGIEIHIEEKEWIEVFTINKDDSITIIGGSAGGKQIDLRKEEQHTFRKIK